MYKSINELKEIEGANLNKKHEMSIIFINN